ncbi:MAG: HAD family hydrolase [Bacteroidetes bacterium]|nr:HAD family hydrolase [Bacteroidota bacterium]
MKKVISIDFWNTLIDTSNSDERKRLRTERCLEVLKPYQPNLTQDDINSSVKKGIEVFNVIWKNEHRTLQTIDVVKNLTSELKLGIAPADEDQLVHIFEVGILDASPNPAPQVAENLRILSASYQLGIISDTHFSPGRIIRQLLDKYNLLGYFSFFAFSDETGVSKPHPEMYHHILRCAGANPFEMVHIGDMNRTDIAGAKALGIHSILYTGVNAEDFQNSIADRTASSWDEIPELILELANI